MAKLIKCSGCGAEISKKAKACPHCGEPVPKSTSLMTWFVLILFIVVLIANITSEDTSKTSTDSNQEKIELQQKIEKQRIQQEKEKFLKSIKPNKEKFTSLVQKEKKVLGGRWESDKVFSFGMFNDGTDRSGFAQYTCILYNEAGLHGKQSTLIKIYDAGKMMNKKEAVVIGKTFCD